MAAVQQFFGKGPSIQDALHDAHMKIKPSQGSDVTRSHVVDWGMEFGGFVQATSFWVLIEEFAALPEE